MSRPPRIPRLTRYMGSKIRGGPTIPGDTGHATHTHPHHPLSYLLDQLRG
jgi:hypothetical protein